MANGQQNCDNFQAWIATQSDEDYRQIARKRHTINFIDRLQTAISTHLLSNIPMKQIGVLLPAECK